MKYALFLDDERFPPNHPYQDNLLIARDFNEACNIVNEFGMSNLIRCSFDHDLGTGKNGLDFAHWLIEQHLDGNHLSDDFTFVVHSMNPVGAANIQNLMDRFLEFRKRLTENE